MVAGNVVTIDPNMAKREQGGTNDFDGWNPRSNRNGNRLHTSLIKPRDWSTRQSLLTRQPVRARAPRPVSVNEAFLALRCARRQIGCLRRRPRRSVVATWNYSYFAVDPNTWLDLEVKTPSSPTSQTYYPPANLYKWCTDEERVTRTLGLTRGFPASSTRRSSARSRSIKTQQRSTCGTAISTTSVGGRDRVEARLPGCS